MHRPDSIRRLQLGMVQILSLKRRVAAADYGLAEILETMVYVVVAVYVWLLWLFVVVGVAASTCAGVVIVGAVVVTW